MNYKKNYQDYAQYVRTLHRQKGAVYYEKHHITPKCVGGDNSPENLVLLTAREHFLAHYLLLKIYKGTKFEYRLAYAFMAMCRENDRQDRYMNSRLYEEGKLRYRELSRQKHREYYTQEVREHISQAVRSSEKFRKAMNDPALRAGRRQRRLGSQQSEDTKKKIGRAGHLSSTAAEPFIVLIDGVAQVWQDGFSALSDYLLKTCGFSISGGNLKNLLDKELLSKKAKGYGIALQLRHLK